MSSILIPVRSLGNFQRPIMLLFIFLNCGLFAFAYSGPLKAGQQHQLHFIFANGEKGYSCFRIPALVTTEKGTVLAFAEGRRNNCGDAGDVDLVVKRSTDEGKTWSDLEVVWNDSSNTCGNPSPVIDKKTGRILLLATWNRGSDHERDIIEQTSVDTRRVFLISSGDDGKTWSPAAEITKDVKRDNWTWYATGPGSGIQMEKGKYRGRLVIACDHIEAVTRKNFSHIIYSDDHGNTWNLGGITPQDSVNESTVAELDNGALMLNMRNASAKRYRQVAISRNGGKSWSDIYADSALPEPVCQGSLIGFDRKGRHILLFSNPASQSSRTSMTLKLSYDNGRSWLVKRLLYKGPSAYSNLTILPEGNIGCLYEAGYQNPYEGIVFEKIAWDDLVTIGEQ